MAKVIRMALATVAGIAVAFALVVAVEGFSEIVHPFPADLEPTFEEMCKHVERYPDWVLAVAAVAWAGTAFASTWVAARLGGLIPGVILILLFLTAVIGNVSMLPYPLWFKLIAPVGIFVGCLLGVRLPLVSKPHMMYSETADDHS